MITHNRIRCRIPVSGHALRGTLFFCHRVVVEDKIKEVHTNIGQLCDNQVHVVQSPEYRRGRGLTQDCRFYCAAQVNQNINGVAYGLPPR
jgi:hypothetical protein